MMIDAIPSASEARSSAVELAELLGVLSLATDLGMGPAHEAHAPPVIGLPSRCAVCFALP